MSKVPSCSKPQHFPSTVILKNYTAKKTEFVNCAYCSLCQKYNGLTASIMSKTAKHRDAMEYYSSSELLEQQTIFGVTVEDKVE